MQKYIQVIVTAVLFLLCQSASVWADSSPQPIKIGALLDLSGEYASAGAAFREGMDLAAEELNQAGGVSGSSVKIIYEDTHYNMKSVASAANKLISIDRVNAAVVSTYTEAMVAGPIFEKFKVPLITLWDSSPEIEAIGDYVFGIGVWAPSTSSVAAEFARQKLHAKTAVTISTNGEWSLGVAAAFRKQFEDAGGKIVGQFELNPSDSDFRTVFTRVKALNPDALYAPVSDNVPAFWIQRFKMGIKAPAISSDILNDDILKSIGSAAEGVYQTQATDPSSEATSQLMARYKKRYGKDCTQIFITSLGFDAVSITAEAVRSHGKEPEKIKEGLYAVRNYPGASGDTTIEAGGSSRKLVSMLRVHNQTLELVR